MNDSVAIFTRFETSNKVSFDKDGSIVNELNPCEFVDKLKQPILMLASTTEWHTHRYLIKVLPIQSKSLCLEPFFKQGSRDSIICKLAYNVIWHLLT